MNKVISFIKNNKRIVIIGSIILVIIIVILCLLLNKNKDKRTEEEKVRDSIKTLAIKYYEEQYYPNIGGSDDLEDKRIFLNEFRYNGIRFKLQVLLKYKEEINYIGPIQFRNNKDNKDCDPINTTFIITPYEPYGVKDYKIDIDLDCGF